RVSAPENAAGALRRLPGPHRDGQPIPQQSRAEGGARGSHRRQSGRHRRHAPAAVEGRGVSRPRAARRGRGTAVRRRAQREDQEALERAMLDFVARKFDVLLATTIVENGLDIPNANTIIINRADRYGLSQLYQLRGRVGRSDRPAYAYLLIPPEDNLSPVAKKRLAAIKEFSDLGSGFRVAALDLEIRGAGNLLGGEQSGHIEAVGFEMYMKLR